MSTNHTANYNLSQWEPTDQVLRADFNEDNEKIDAALAAHAVQLTKLGNCRVEMFSVYDNPASSENNPLYIQFSGQPMLLVLFGDRFLIIGNKTDTGVNLNMNYNDVSMGNQHFEWVAGNRIKTSAINGMYRGRTYQVIAFYAEDAQ